MFTIILPRYISYNMARKDDKYSALTTPTGPIIHYLQPICDLTNKQGPVSISEKTSFRKIS